MAALTAALLVLAACGSNDDSATETPGDTPTPVVTPTPGPLPANGVGLGQLAALFTLTTPDAGDFRANATALASGDFNGDGRTDLAVGAPFADGPDNDRPDGAGEVYVLFDTASLSGETDLAAAAGFTVYGVEKEEFTGRAIAVGDLNGDGTDDLIISAPGVTAEPDPRTDQGRVYVFFGGPGLTGTVDLADQDPPPWDFVLTGAEGFSNAGHALAIADVNGDGTDDLVIGAPFAGRVPGTEPGGPRLESGAVYVVYGGPGLSGEVNIAFDDPDVVIQNQERFSGFGSAVVAGDLNGDGIADIVVGAPQFAAAGRPDAGAVFVYFGAASLPRAMAFSDADVVFDGAEGDGLGYRLAILPRDDGPGRLVMTAPRADGPDDTLPSAGDVYVFDNVGAADRVDLAVTAADVTIYAPEQAMSFGDEVAIGDVDGDGAPDLIVSAPQSNARLGSRRVAGRTAIIFGPTIAGVVDLSGGDGFLWLEGVEDGGQSGVSLALADFNGDGENNLAIAAARSGPGGDRPGRVWILAPLP